MDPLPHNSVPGSNFKAEDGYVFLFLFEVIIMFLWILLEGTQLIKLKSSGMKI